jgi:hypothetical protein
MRQPEGQRAITRDWYDAVLLDLDGMLMDTANLHAAAWKQKGSGWNRHQRSSSNSVRKR